MERDAREDQKELQHRRVPPNVFSYCPRGGSSGCSGTLLRGGKERREKVRPESERSPRSSSSACCGHSPVADYHSQDASRGLWAGLPPNSEFHWLTPSKGGGREKEPGCLLRVVPGNSQEANYNSQDASRGSQAGLPPTANPIGSHAPMDEKTRMSMPVKEGDPALLLSLGNSFPHARCERIRS